MNDLTRKPATGDTRLEELVALAERAAHTIERLQSKLRAQRDRIAQLEQAEAALKPAAERYLRMKAQLEALPAAKGGFTAHGVTYTTFDEAFDAAYPAVKPARDE